MTMIHSRRRFIIQTSLLPLIVNVKAHADTREELAQYPSQQEGDAWMRALMKHLGAASGMLHLSRFADPMYFLEKPITWSPNPGEEVQKVEVPKGFVTDFASIPRAFWSLLPPDNDYTYPAILHDFLYWTQAVSRKDADLVLLYAMKEFKVKKSSINIIYDAVRLGGETAWKDNAKLKQAGEKRILTVFPTDPKIRWAEWKQRKDVF
jgi:hypothetical protein